MVRLACLAFILTAASVLAANGQPARRVLMLFSEGKDLPVNVMIGRAVKSELAAHSTNRIEFQADHLGTGRPRRELLQVAPRVSAEETRLGDNWNLISNPGLPV